MRMHAHNANANPALDHGEGTACNLSAALACLSRVRTALDECLDDVRTARHDARKHGWSSSTVYRAHVRTSSGLDVARGAEQGLHVSNERISPHTTHYTLHTAHQMHTTRTH